MAQVEWLTAGKTKRARIDLSSRRVTITLSAEGDRVSLEIEGAHPGDLADRIRQRLEDRELLA